ncbi:creatininase family protein [Arthrobacter sp. STN4]|uniref:creatininase family protein n=1 Tax=Arthrobacter sp. STN4 TaxID=2923276 RepID=UPI00211A4887|nr:creatininase family protein [Arthrobacter sp. STN4]MCQ9163997.1 creatininase family protein [Arthrobacter sp. STN4]
MTEYQWNRLSAPALKYHAEHDAVVMLPVGSTEQHGEHLPTGVDLFLAAEACLRAAAILEEAGMPVVCAPGLPWGLSEHHMAFGGTLTLPLTTYYALIRDVCASIQRSGFQRIVVVNGHGGNISALNAIVDQLSLDLPGADISVATYVTVARDQIEEILETQDSIMHACEGETSMMLAAFPELVATGMLSRATGPVSGLRSDAVPLYRWRSFRDVTANGVSGDARGATADKGTRLLDVCAEALAHQIMVDGGHEPGTAPPNPKLT